MFLRKQKGFIVCVIFLSILTLYMFFDSTKTSMPIKNQFFKSLGVNDYIDAFNAMDQRLNGGIGYSNYLDTIGYLSWRQSRIIDSYLNLYEATKDLHYLEKFISQADLILLHRDDYIYGRAPAWSNLKYLKAGAAGEPYPLLVNNAMIMYPFARFAAMVLKNERLALYHNVALRYLSNVQQTVDYFSRWYITDGRRGWYIWPDEEFITFPGLEAPHNWNAAMGKVFIALYDATERELYLKQAEAIANAFKDELEIAPNNSYIWHYWRGTALEQYKAYEDVSHGSIDVQFAIMAYQHDIVFDLEDIKRFVTTFKENLWNGQDFASNVYGNGKVKESIADTGMFYIGLSKVDHGVTSIIERYIAGKDFRDLPEEKYNWYMWTISNILLMQQELGLK